MIFLYTHWYIIIFYDTSMLITVYIAVVRCCCVAIPLKFKGVFTKSRTVVAIVVIVICAVLMRLPTLITQKIVKDFDVSNNRTVYRLQYTADRDLAITVNDIMNRSVIWWLAMSTMSVCVVILAVSLRSSSKFRKSAQETSTPSSEKATSQTSRDVRVVKMVVVITVLYLSLSLPSTLYSLVRRLVPSFNSEQGQTRVFGMVAQASYLCGFLNATLNTLVYYRANSRYKAIVISFFAKITCKK